MTHHRRNPSTATKTGAARMKMRTYRSWMSCPWVLMPCCAQPASNAAPARSAAAAPERRIIRSAHRELVDHPDGEVNRAALGLALWRARLPAGHRVGARRQREHPGDGRAGVHLADLAEVQPAVLGLVARGLGGVDDVLGALPRGQPDHHHLVGDREGLMVAEG